jgi:hypothetical protein
MRGSYLGDLISLLSPGVHLVNKLLVEGLEFLSLGELEEDLHSLGLVALESLGLHASLLYISVLCENLCNSHCSIDTSLSSSM